MIFKNQELSFRSLATYEDREDAERYARVVRHEGLDFVARNDISSKYLGRSSGHDSFQSGRRLTLATRRDSSNRARLRVSRSNENTVRSFLFRNMTIASQRGTQYRPRFRERPSKPKTRKKRNYTYVLGILTLLLICAGFFAGSYISRALRHDANAEQRAFRRTDVFEDDETTDDGEWGDDPSTLTSASVVARASSSSLETPSTRAQDAETRSRLVKYFAKVNPDKLATVDKALVVFKHRHVEMFAKLKEKYGVDPLGSAFGPVATSDEDANGDDDDDDEEDEDDARSEQLAVPLLADKTAESDAELQVLVVGMPGTGVEEVVDLLSSKGLSVSGEVDAIKRLSDVGVFTTDELVQFDAFSDVAVAHGVGVSAFFEEILQTYPSAHVIVCVRPLDEWRRDHVETLISARCALDAQCVASASLAYGVDPRESSPLFSSPFYRTHVYAKFYDRVMRAVPRTKRLLVQKGTSLGYVSHFLFDDSLPPAKKQTAQLSSMHRVDHSAIPTNGQLKFVIVGFDASGVDQIAHFLYKMSYASSRKTMKCVSKDASCTSLSHLLESANARPTFGSASNVYADVQVLAHAYVSVFLEELILSNPDAKIVLATRRTDSSFFRDIASCVKKHPHNKALLYSTLRTRFALTKRYYDFVDSIASLGKRLGRSVLALDVSDRRAKEDLCEFLRDSRCMRAKTRLHTTYRCFG